MARRPASPTWISAARRLRLRPRRPWISRPRARRRRRRRPVEAQCRTEDFARAQPGGRIVDLRRDDYLVRTIAGDEITHAFGDGFRPAHDRMAQRAPDQ